MTVCRTEFLSHVLYNLPPVRCGLVGIEEVRYIRYTLLTSSGEEDYRIGLMGTRYQVR